MVAGAFFFAQSHPPKLLHESVNRVTQPLQRTHEQRCTTRLKLAISCIFWLPLRPQDGTISADHGCGARRSRAGGGKVTMNRQSRIAALAVLFMLVVPLVAHAGHDHDDGDQDRPGWHDNGRHKGWYKHHHHHDDDDDAPPPQQTYYPGRQVCDGDGDDCHVIAPEPMVRPHWDNRYVCDGDRDDCHWTSGAGENYWRQNGGYNYGAPYSWYEALPPSALSLEQRRQWLENRRRHAMFTIKSMRERGDSKAAGRMAKSVQTLDRQINALNGELRRGY